MWWLLFVGGFVAFLVFAALYAEFRGHRGGADHRATDTSANYMIINALSNGRRNQTSGLP